MGIIEDKKRGGHSPRNEKFLRVSDTRRLLMESVALYSIQDLSLPASLTGKLCDDTADGRKSQYVEEINCQIILISLRTFSNICTSR